jgi:GTP1/Obg family GTP-binding protein
MYNYDDIIARLRAGEDSEVIAKEMVDTLNRANRDFVDEQNKINEVATQKAEMVEDMLDLIEDYVRQFHSQNPLVQVFKEVRRDGLDTNELVDNLDKAIDEVATANRLMNQLKADLEKAFGDRTAKQDHIIPAKGKTVNSDALGAFLKANGLA